MDRFNRCENLKHYRELLERTADEQQRKHIKKVIADIKQMQIEAGDFNSDSEKQAAMAIRLPNCGHVHE